MFRVYVREKSTNQINLVYFYPYEYIYVAYGRLELRFCSRRLACGLASGARSEPGLVIQVQGATQTGRLSPAFWSFVERWSREASRLSRSALL